LWPSLNRCFTSGVDYSAKFENEKHSFSLTGTPAQKSEVNTFSISSSTHVDFIPLDILSEFPNLNALMIGSCNLPTLKSGLFKEELQKIQYLWLYRNKIEVIEPEAFKFLTRLNWIRLNGNNLKTLSYRVFQNNPDLIYIDLKNNQIKSIHPNFFDGLNKLKLIGFSENVCIDDNIGCETCLITQSELREIPQGCFDHCSKGTFCLNSYLAHEPSPISTTEKSIESNSIEKEVEGIEEQIDCQLGESSQNFTASLRDTQKAVEAVNKGLVDLESSVENMPKVIEKAIEANNQNMQECCAANQKSVEKLQEAVESHSRNVEKELKELKDFLKQELNEKRNIETQLKVLEEKFALMVQEKLDDLKDRLENNRG
jgi:hypothetical protein